MSLRGISQVASYQPQRQTRRGPSLTAIGAEAGGGAALAQLLTELGGDMIQGAQDKEAAAVSAQGEVEGYAAGDRAAAEGRAPDLPTGETIRDQALKKGALAGWLARLDVDTQTKAETWAAEHADNPDGFRANWDGMKAGYLKAMPADVAPMVAQELDRRGATVFAKLTAAKTIGDRRKGEERANADILQAQLLSERNSDAAWREGRIADAQAEDGKWLGYLANRTDLDERDKVTQRDTFQRTHTRSAVLGQFERVKAGGLAVAEKFIGDFRKPGAHAGMDPDDVEKISAEMDRHLSDLRERQRLAVADLRERAHDALWRAERGYGTQGLAELSAKARALGDGDLSSRLSEATRTAELAGELAKLPLAKLKDRASQYEAEAKASPDAKLARRAELAKSVFAETVRQSAIDAMGYAQSQGLDVAKVDWAKTDSLQARGLDADRLAGHYGFRVPVLSRPEADDLSARLESGSVEERADLLGKLHQGFGARHLPSVLEQIKEKHPEAAHAGALMGHGPDGARAARDILFGAELRKAVGKEGAAAGRQYMPPKDDAFKARFEAELPHELVAGMKPETLAGLQSAILSSYAAKSHAAGLASQTTVATTLFRKAVADVTGGVVEFNGKPVFAPVRGMKQGDFDALMAGLGDADLAGAGVTAKQFKDYGRLHMVSPGRYLVEVSGQYRGEPGKPFVLDLSSRARR